MTTARGLRLATLALTTVALAGCGLLSGGDRLTQPVAAAGDRSTAPLTTSPTDDTTATSASSAPKPKPTATTPKPKRSASATPTPGREATTTAKPKPRPTTTTRRTTPKPTTTRATPRKTPTTAPPGSSSSAAEAEVLRLVNVERRKAGCGALTSNTTLVTVARAHSKDMAVKGYFDHNSPDGRTPFQRMTDAGYRYSSAAENIAAGQPTPAAVMDAWMNSPGHKANILNCGLKQLGVGMYKSSSSKYGIYWTQDFGTPR